MLVKDQLKVRMDQLTMSVGELARRVGVSSQSVRHWLAGRSFPGKSKCNLIEEALSFKLDFSEGESMQSLTVEQTLKQTSVSTLMTISRLPPEQQLEIAKIANSMANMQHRIDQLEGQLKAALVATPAPAPTQVLLRDPPKPANHGRVISRVLRSKVVAKTTK